MTADQVFEVVYKNREKFNTLLPRQEREEYISKLRSSRYFHTDKTWDDPRNNFVVIDVLLRLGDAETGRWLISQQFVDDEGYISDPNSSNSDILKRIANLTSSEGYHFMAKLLEINQDYAQRGSDMISKRASFYAQHFILNEMIPNTYELPENVRDWSKKLDDQEHEATKLGS